jgi:polysaccharide biosynthesis/export protein
MRLSIFVGVIACAIPLLGQNVQQRRIDPLLPADEFLTNRPSNAPSSLTSEEYRIGPDDLVDVSVFDAPDLGGASRVSAAGGISLPLIGPVQALGKTTQELQQAIEQELKSKYVKDPHVTVFIREYASQPVSIIGAVKQSGIFQMKGQKYLLDMLAQSGIDSLTAGNLIQVIRRRSSEGDSPQTININAEDLLKNGKTELNILIHPGDTINVLQAGSIFVVGEVIRGGEFPLKQGKNVTAAQAIALGSGFTKEAKRTGCKIIRFHDDGSREEIPLNLAKVFDGSLQDLTLQPNDILFVPSNRVKTGLLKTLDSTITVVSGRLIYRF